jgi:hypothetical protein
MRTLTTQESAALAAPDGYTVHTRVLVNTTGNTWVDVTALQGRNWLASVSYDETIDQPVASCTVTLRRRSDALTLNPLVTSSTSNVLALGRTFTVETATTDTDVAPGENLLLRSQEFDNATWVKTQGTVTANGTAAPDGTTTADLFVPSTSAAQHYVRQVAAGVPGVSHTMTVLVKPVSSINKVTFYPGQSGTFAHFNLANLTTSRETNVTSNAITPAGNGWYRLTATWPANILPTDPRVYVSSGTLGSDAIAGDGTSGIYLWGAQLEAAPAPSAYRATTAAKVGDWREVFRGVVETLDVASDPLTFTGTDLGGVLQRTFIETPRTYGSTGGTAIETVIQSILTDNGTGVTLRVVGTPSVMLSPFVQKEESVLEAVRTLALRIGWDCRYRWDSSTSTFRLTLYQPNRAGGAASWTWQPYHYQEVDKVEQTLLDVRNVVRLTYYDRTAMVGGSPTLTPVVKTDATSIAAYGRQFMGIVEGKESTIDSPGEADAMATAALADLKQPLLALSATCTFLYAAELGDMQAFKANGEHFSADQTLAVVSLSHELTPDGATTTVGLRGTPVAASADWLRMEERTGKADTATVVAPPAPTSVTLAAVPRGFTVAVAPSTTPPLAESYELHVSTSTIPATPTASTLRQQARDTLFTVADLVPGTTYYVRTVPRDAAGNRGTASAEQTVVAGKVVAADLGAGSVGTGALASASVGTAQLKPEVYFGTWPANGDWEEWPDANAAPIGWTCTTVGTGSVAFWRQDSTYSGGSPSGAYTLGARPGSGYGSIVSGARNVGAGEEVVFSTRLTALDAFGTVGATRIRMTIIWQDATGADLSYTTADYDVDTTWGKPADVPILGYVNVRGTAPSAATQFRVAFENLQHTTGGGTQHVAIWFARVSVGQPWHYVGTTGGGDTIYQNGWATYGGPTQGAAFRLENGVVRVRGWIYHPTGSSNYVFQLPPGLRPGVDLTVPCYSSAGLNFVAVFSDGWVYSFSATGGSTNYRLDGISFVAEN